MRLCGLRAYLAGNIDLCPNGGVEWRRSLIPWLTLRDVTVFDPTNKPVGLISEDQENIGYRQQLKKEKEYDELSRVMREISNIDLRMVDICDFLIAYINLNIYACGTIHEIALANSQKKPVLVVCKQGKSNVPDWLYGRLNHDEFFDDFHSLKDYLNQVDCDPAFEPNKRWLFFSKQHLQNSASREKILCER